MHGRSAIVQIDSFIRVIISLASIPPESAQPESARPATAVPFASSSIALTLPLFPAITASPPVDEAAKSNGGTQGYPDDRSNRGNSIRGGTEEFCLVSVRKDLLFRSTDSARLINSL